jgi:Fe-Mn family superoxide dismutase
MKNEKTPASGPYAPKNFEHLLGTPGFSDKLLKTHFTLYEGYVKNTNKLIDEMDALLDKDKGASPEYAEMKRRFGWEFNGMRLHEYYFGNMKKGGAQLTDFSELSKKIKENFDSLEYWEKDFKATGAMRGIGWVLTYYDPMDDCLMNVWVDEHDTGHLAGCPPVLVMDVFEHAYMNDYGTNRADYIKAFFAAIDWEEAGRRYDQARTLVQEAHSR